MRRPSALGRTARETRLPLLLVPASLHHSPPLCAAPTGGQRREHPRTTIGSTTLLHAARGAMLRVVNRGSGTARSPGSSAHAWTPGASLEPRRREEGAYGYRGEDSIRALLPELPTGVGIACGASQRPWSFRTDPVRSDRSVSPSSGNSDDTTTTTPEISTQRSSRICPANDRETSRNDGNG